MLVDGGLTAHDLAVSSFSDRMASRLSSMPRSMNSGLSPYGFAVVGVEERTGHPHRIAEEEPLVERLASAEGTDRRIPCQPEEGDPFARLGPRGTEELREFSPPGPSTSASVGAAIGPLALICWMISTKRG
ncbi:MAG: hypothetical protein R3A46_16365 [Thermomicrobiales bacterium]